MFTEIGRSVLTSVSGSVLTLRRQILQVPSGSYRPGRGGRVGHLVDRDWHPQNAETLHIDEHNVAVMVLDVEELTLTEIAQMQSKV